MREYRMWICFKERLGESILETVKLSSKSLKEASDEVRKIIDSYKLNKNSIIHKIGLCDDESKKKISVKIVCFDNNVFESTKEIINLYEEYMKSEENLNMKEYLLLVCHKQHTGDETVSRLEKLSSDTREKAVSEFEQIILPSLTNPGENEEFPSIVDYLSRNHLYLGGVSIKIVSIEKEISVSDYVQKDQKIRDEYRIIHNKNKRYQEYLKLKEEFEGIQ